MYVTLSPEISLKVRCIYKFLSANSADYFGIKMKTSLKIKIMFFGHLKLLSINGHERFGCHFAYVS